MKKRLNNKRYFVIVKGYEREFFAGTLGFILDQYGEVTRVSKDKSMDGEPAGLNVTNSKYVREVPHEEYFLCVGEVVGTLH